MTISVGARRRIVFLLASLTAVLAVAPVLPARPATTPAITLATRTIGGPGAGVGTPSPYAFGRLPLRFEPNRGQTDAAVRFVARGAGYTLFLTPTQVVLALAARLSGAGAGGRATARPGASGGVARLAFVGANLRARPVGAGRLPGVSNYFLGADPRRWRTDVPGYARVAVPNLYPGVDAIYYGHTGRLEYDLIVRPGARVDAVRLAVSGVSGARLDERGDLELLTAAGPLVQRRPVLYQWVAGMRRLVAGRYVWRGRGQLAVAVGAYDRARPLVIDPVLDYATYLGGTGDSTSTPGAGDHGLAIAADVAGDAYVTGVTTSIDFPTRHPLQKDSGGPPDAFVTKLNPAGNALVYSTYLGGGSDDQGTGIAVDRAGDAYVVGATTSTDFPLRAALQRHNRTGDNGPPTTNAFVAELNPVGDALVYSTYLGGSGVTSANSNQYGDEGAAIAVDGTGAAYVTGSAVSRDFPLTHALQARPGGGTCPNGNDAAAPCADAFVAKLAPHGGTLVYSTLLGGGGDDHGRGIAADAAGNAYVTGETASRDFPTRAAFQRRNRGGSSGRDAFVTKLDARGALAYSTYLGGRDDDDGVAIAVDRAGAAYVEGVTSSPDFYTFGPLLETGPGGGVTSAFVSKLAPRGDRLVYSKYLGSAYDTAYGTRNAASGGVAVDAAGDAYVTGFGATASFPPRNPIPGGKDTGQAVAEINPRGSALIYNAPLDTGGGGNRGLAVDAAGGVYVVGYTNASSDIRTKNPVQAANNNGDGQDNGFVIKIGPASGAGGQ